MTYALRPTMFGVGLVVSLVVLGCRAPGPQDAPATATVVAPQRTTTYHVRDERGRRVTVTIPAMRSQDVSVNPAADGTVPVTVTALDVPQQQAHVLTQRGQRLVLTLQPELLARLRVGDSFLIQEAPPAGP